MKIVNELCRIAKDFKHFGITLGLDMQIKVFWVVKPCGIVGGQTFWRDILPPCL